jgi:hypothetical protein
LTVAPAKTRAAFDEWKTGIDQFIQWASMARRGETSEPAALAADQALTAFSEGRFSGGLIGVAMWTVLACNNIRDLVRNAHWHLRLCPWCQRWLLAKAENRVFCRRTDCVRRQWAAQQAASRTARHALMYGDRAHQWRQRTK